MRPDEGAYVCVKRQTEDVIHSNHPKIENNSSKIQGSYRIEGSIHTISQTASFSFFAHVDPGTFSTGTVNKSPRFEAIDNHFLAVCSRDLTIQLRADSIITSSFVSGLSSYMVSDIHSK